MTTETVATTSRLEPTRGRLPVRRADLWLVAAASAADLREQRPVRQVAARRGLELRGDRPAARRRSPRSSSPSRPCSPCGVAGPLVRAQPAGHPRLTAPSPSPAARWPTSMRCSSSTSASPCCWSTSGSSSSCSGSGCAPAGRPAALTVRRRRPGARRAGPRPRPRRAEPPRPRRRRVGPARRRRPGHLLRPRRRGRAACRRSRSPGSAWAPARVVLAVLGAVGVVPLEFAGTGGRSWCRAALPWWVAIGELALVAAAAAYLLGVTAARVLGSTVASFVGLTEVLFAVLFAWLLLGELPGLVQLAGGVVIVAGVVAVRLGERPTPTGSASGAADQAFAGTQSTGLADVHTGPMPQPFGPVPRVGVVTGRAGDRRRHCRGAGRRRLDCRCRRPRTTGARAGSRTLARRGSSCPLPRT